MNVQGRILVLALVIASPAAAQNNPPPPEPAPGHGLSQVDPARGNEAIAVPLPEQQERRLRKYEIPELLGSRQALGSQVVDGELPKPLLDYFVHQNAVEQRISLFERGLVIVRMTGAGATLQKKLIIPEGAVERYLRLASPAALRAIRDSDLSAPQDERRAFLRLYDKDGTVVERVFDPARVKPKRLDDQVGPLEDLLRAISEDRMVSSTVAGYEPKVGDELVGDDGRVYRVERIIAEGEGVVQLRCTTQPTLMYVAKKDLYNYFVGRAGE